MPTSFDREGWQSLETDSRKYYAPSPKGWDVVVSKRPMADDKLSSWVPPSSSTRKGKYAISFEFLRNNILPNDGKACVFLHRESDLPVIFTSERKCSPFMMSTRVFANLTVTSPRNPTRNSNLLHEIYIHT